MDINVRINKINTTGSVKATASVTLDECFGIRGVKVMDGKNGLFINMPSYKGGDGKYTDICFPTTAEFRKQLADSVVEAYKLAIEQIQKQSSQYDPSAYDEPVSEMSM